VVKNDQLFAIKELPYKREDKKKVANKEVGFLKTLKGTTPFIVQFIESFEKV
jgi:hypothetical protein